MDNPLSDFEHLPYDTFRYSILRGNLRPKDLLVLCNSSRDFNAKCNRNNQEIFQRLIERDFGVKFKDIETLGSPMQSYVKLNKYPELTYILKYHPGKAQDFYLSLERYPEIVPFLRKYYPDWTERLLWYWIEYMDSIVELFHDNYPKEDSPKWVNYEL